MKEFIKQQRQVWASLKGQPGFVLSVVSTMGVTVGALLCVLTLVYTMLLAPLPYPQADKLYKINNLASHSGGERKIPAFSYPAMVKMYQDLDQFEAMAMASFGQDVLTTHPKQPVLDLGFVTPEWFDLLGAKMAIGNGFDNTMGLETHVPVAILSHQTWQREFDSDPDILSKTVDFTGVSYRIIGVLNDDFVEPALYQTGMQTQVWLPWDFNQQSWLKIRWDRMVNELMLVGKLKSGTAIGEFESSQSQAQTEIWQRYAGFAPHMRDVQVTIKLQSFEQAILGDVGNTLLLLVLGVVGLVLIATTNIANLFMSRTAGQQQSLAIRAAIGADRSMLFKELLIETIQLMVLAMLVALPVASLGFVLLGEYLSDIFAHVEQLSLGWFTLLLAVLAVVIFALVFAALRSRMINYRALNTMLQSSGKGTSVQVSKRTRSVLIFTQVAIAASLVFANGLLFIDALKTIKQPMGFEVDNIQRLNLSYSAPRWPAQEALIPSMIELQTRVEQLPQVESVSRSYSPLRRFAFRVMTDLDTNERLNFEYKTVSHDAFKMVEQELIEGDFFSEDHQREQSKVMIVNDVMAKRLSPDGSVIGRKLLGRMEQEYIIIGVVRGITIPGETDVPMRAYGPTILGLGSMMMKLKPGVEITREEMVSLVAEVDPMFSVGRFDNLAALRGQKLASQYLTVATTVALALLSLGIAAIGLYGILSYASVLRRTEFGTRMAIGADEATLVKLVVIDNAPSVVGGLILSMIILLSVFLWQQQWLSPLVNSSSVFVFIYTLSAIVFITAIACYLPLRQFVKHPVIYSLRGSQ